MDKLVDHLFVFEGNGIVNGFSGNYSEYREKLKVEEKGQKGVQNKAEEVKEIPKENSKNEKLSFKEKYEFENLQSEIDGLEIKKEKIVSLLNADSSHHEELIKLTKELDSISKLIDEKTFRWLELSDRS
jgi:ATP-binding cassette subfamily F protein uup